MNYGGSKPSSLRLEASGLLNSISVRGLVPTADELAGLSDEDFRKALEGFRVYRQAIKSEQAMRPRPSK